MINSTCLLGAVVLGFTLSLTGLPADAQNSQVASVKGDFYEYYDKDLGRVSGDIIMGVMLGPLIEPENTAAKMADFAPRNTADVIVPSLSQSVATMQEYCIRINSKDGRFEAENTYTIEGEPEAVLPPFVYGGKHFQILKDMRAVTLVKLGNCGDRTEVVVPSTWSGTASANTSETLHVFVNSAGNPTGLSVGNDPDFIECVDVADETTLKYTSVCIIPIEALAAQQENGFVRLSFFVTRSLGEDVFDLSVTIPLSGK